MIANRSGLYTAKPASEGPVGPTLEAGLENAGGGVVEGPDALGESCVGDSIVIEGCPGAAADSIVDG